MNALLRLLRQPTSVGGLSALIATLVAAHTGAMSWDNAVPVVVGGLAAILLPDNAHAKTDAEDIARQVMEALQKAAQNADTAAKLLVMALPLLAGLSLAACSPVQQQKAVETARVLCAVDGVAQPIFVAVAPVTAGQAGATAAVVDMTVVHPTVVAACAALNGIPVKVDPVAPAAAPAAPAAPAPAAPATPAAN